MSTRQFPFVLHGDAVSAVIDIIQNHTPELATYTASEGVTISSITSNLVGYQQGLYWILVSVAGGSYKFLNTKRTRVDITVYGGLGPDSSGRANDMSLIIQASMFAWQQGYRGHGVYYHACQIETDIFESSDKDEESCRYVQSLRLLLLPEDPVIT